MDCISGSSWSYHPRRRILNEQSTDPSLFLEYRTKFGIPGETKFEHLPKRFSTPTRVNGVDISRSLRAHSIQSSRAHSAVLGRSLVMGILIRVGFIVARKKSEPSRGQHTARLQAVWDPWRILGSPISSRFITV